MVAGMAQTERMVDTLVAQLENKQDHLGKVVVDEQRAEGAARSTRRIEYKRRCELLTKRVGQPWGRRGGRLDVNSKDKRCDLSTASVGQAWRRLIVD